jgi:hypothetical protein
MSARFSHLFDWSSAGAAMHQCAGRAGSGDWVSGKHRATGTVYLGVPC